MKGTFARAKKGMFLRFKGKGKGREGKGRDSISLLTGLLPICVTPVVALFLFPPTWFGRYALLLSVEGA